MATHAQPDGRSSASLQVSSAGALTLSSHARIFGPIHNLGVVRFQLPAPLGTFVSGGYLRSCDEEDSRGRGRGRGDADSLAIRVGTNSEANFVRAKITFALYMLTTADGFDIQIPLLKQTLELLEQDPVRTRESLQRK